MSESWVQTVLDDLSKAAEADRAKAFEAGRLSALEEQFPIRQESYIRGAADERSKLVTKMRSQICFKFAEGECEHGACYNLNDFIAELTREDKK